MTSQEPNILEFMENRVAMMSLCYLYCFFKSNSQLKRPIPSALVVQRLAPLSQTRCVICI